MVVFRFFELMALLEEGFLEAKEEAEHRDGGKLDDVD